MQIKNINKRRDYVNISKNGKKLTTNNFIIQYKKSQLMGVNLDEEKVNIGIVASKKVGNAVERNYVKRRIRAISKIAVREITICYDFVIIGKKSILKEDFKILKVEIKKAFEEISKQKR